MTIKIDDNCYYRVKDLVNLLSLNELTIRNYLRKGKLRGFKASRFWYISGRNLRIFLEGNRKKILGVF